MGHQDRDIADPVQGVLDGPVALDPGGEGAWWGLGHRDGADDVDDLDALAAFDDSGPADLQDLDGAGPVDPGRDLHRLDRSGPVRPWRRSR